MALLRSKIGTCTHKVGRKTLNVSPTAIPDRRDWVPNPILTLSLYDLFMWMIKLYKYLNGSTEFTTLIEIYLMELPFLSQPKKLAGIPFLEHFIYLILLKSFRGHWHVEHLVISLRTTYDINSGFLYVILFIFLDDAAPPL
ncbi:hypothetical protein ACJX0J_015996 [Zea mays]